MYPDRTFAAAALALLAAIPASPALADETDSESEAIVVTATRQAMRTNELLSDVTVIDRSVIEASGPETISASPAAARWGGIAQPPSKVPTPEVVM